SEQPSTTTSTTTATTATSTTPATAPAAASSTTSHTVVHTDGGWIEVTGDGSQLNVVATATSDDWTFHIDHQDPTRIEASFAREGAHTAVVIELTPTGIRSSASSVS